MSPLRWRNELPPPPLPPTPNQRPGGGGGETHPTVIGPIATHAHEVAARHKGEESAPSGRPVGRGAGAAPPGPSRNEEREADWGPRSSLKTGEGVEKRFSVWRCGNTQEQQGKF